MRPNQFLCRLAPKSIGNWTLWGALSPEPRNPNLLLGGKPMVQRYLDPCKGYAKMPNRIKKEIPNEVETGAMQRFFGLQGLGFGA